MRRSDSPEIVPPRATPPVDWLAARALPLAVILLLLLFVQGACFIGESSQTSDEAAHLAAGYSYLKTGDFRLNLEHPPLLKELAAFPLLVLDLDFPRGELWERAEEWNIGRLFVHQNRLPNDTILLVARLPMLLLSLGLAWTIFSWGRRLFGGRGALLATSLYVLDPNVVAHSCLVTTDLGVTLFIFLSVYLFWRWVERPAPRTLVLAGLAAGACFASKFTALWLLPMLAALSIVVFAGRAPLPLFPWSARSPVAPGGARAPSRLVALGLAALLIAALAGLVVAASYAFVGLPAFFRGLTIGLRHSAAGHISYLMGRISETGWWYYFPLAYLLKTPIGTLLAIALLLAAILSGRRLRACDELFLWIPIAVTVLITCFWKVNIGLRHLLPIYPFLYLAAGRIALPPAPGERAGRFVRSLPALAIACLVFDLEEAARILPYDLTYFNQLAGGPENGHLYLLDSNLDWGQSSKALRRYVSDEGVPAIDCAFGGNSDPWYYGVSYQYVPGSGNLDAAKRRPIRLPDGLPRELLAVSPMVLHGVHFNDHHLYDWLLDKRPIARPGYTYFVYDVTGDAPSHAQIAALYLNFGLLDLADHEAHRTLRIDPKNELAQAVLDKLRDEAAKGAGKEKTE